MAVERLPRFHPLAAPEGRWLIGDSWQRDGRSIAISEQTYTYEEAKQESLKMSKEDENA